MERRSLWRSAVAGLLLAAMVIAAPLMLTRSDGVDVPTDATPTIELNGMRLTLDKNGDIQACVDVYLKGVVYSGGAELFLKYNPNWLSPSDYNSNDVLNLTGSGLQDVLDENENNDFFVYNPDLYVKTLTDGTVIKESPFASSTAGAGTQSEYYRRLDTTKNLISLKLYLDIDKDGKLYEDFNAQDEGKLTISGNVLRSDVDWGENEGEQEKFYYFGEYERDANGDVVLDEERYPVLKSAEATRIRLGTLSFRVTDRAALRAMVEGYKGVYYWYGNSTITETNADSVTVTPPLYADASKQGLVSNYTYPWYVWAYTQDGEDTQLYKPTTYQVPTEAAAEISYDFGDGLIAAELLQPEIAINAYRAYSFESGNQVEMAKENVAAALRKYSPTVVASYADAHVANFTMNWGAADPDPSNPKYDFRVYTEYTGYNDKDIVDALLTDPENAEYASYLVHTEYEYAYDEATGELTNKTEKYSLWQDIESIDGFVYDPRGGEYVASQYFWYDSGTKVEETGEPIFYQYPNPVEAHLEVTPVHVSGVTASGLDKRYTREDAEKVNTTADLELPAEVRINTEEVSGAPSLFLEVGGEGAELPDWEPSTSDMTTLIPRDGANKHWPMQNDNTAGDGDYIFALGELIGEGESVTARPVYAEDIQAKYPWLTAGENYPIEAVRRVLPDGEALYTYNVTHVRTTAAQYYETMDDYTRDNLTLVLGVWRNETRSGIESADSANFGPDAAFRIRMPNGREIGLGATVGEDTPDWFAGANMDGASYSTSTENVSYESATVTARTLILIPGITSDSAQEEKTAEDRADLRRMINLGGYFEIAVCEDTSVANPYWSEFMPVYVSPRQNTYEESKEHNFIGLNAGLMDYRGKLSTTVTLPTGEYTPVAIDGENANTFMDTKIDYGVLTTYDGSTGEQPGRIYTFRVKPNSDGTWDTAADTTVSNSVFGNVKKYNNTGVNDFDTMVYDGYGEVANRTDEIFEPVLRLGTPENTEMPVESLHLIYNGTEKLNVLTAHRGNYDEVTDAKFDTQTEGYIVRQSFVLTLLNDGDTGIDGIYIDTLTDELHPAENSPYSSDGGGGHFEITDPPASFLAAGCSTDFTITYVMDLRATNDGDPLDYLDKLYVCSNRSGVASRLCEFDAHFTVTKNPVSRVTVVVLPPFHTDLNDEDSKIFYLGEAGVIGGVTTGENGVQSMDYNYASSTRTEGETVYIGAFPYEEYEVLAVVAAGSSPEILRASKNDVGGTWENAWQFSMPARDVTVYVIFYEPVLSKLRPQEINVYASSDPEKVASRDSADRADTEKVLWQKSFTAEEMEKVTSTDETSGNNVIDDMTLMTGGRAAMKDYNATESHYLVEREDDEGYDTIKGNAHYLVVLEKEDEYVQADMLLRKVVALTDGVNEAIKNQLQDTGYIDWDVYENKDITGIDITMDVYRPNEAGDSYVVEKVYGSEGDTGDDMKDGMTKNYNIGNTSVPSKHTSTVFKAPAEGEREWLVISLSYQTDTDQASRVTRSYYIELVRRPSYAVTKNYGNSPVGMIYNTYEFRDGDGLNAYGTAALELFESTRSFAGAEMLPYAYTIADGQESTIDASLDYNREAWVEQGLLYDSDSQTSVDTYYVGIAADGTKITASDVHKTKTNANNGGTVEYLDFSDVEDYRDLDLDPYSLFVLLGTDFTDPGLFSMTDSSMREVEPSRVNRYIKDAVLLDDTALTQSQRFAGVSATSETGASALHTVNIDLGTLEDSPYQEWQKWQATHRYSQETYSYNGHLYPVFYNPDTYAPDTDVAQSGNIFYFEYNGLYFACGTHDRLLDEEITEKLEPKYTDEAQSVSIRPGVYQLVYEFDDFDSAVDPDREPLRETRYIVVLGAIGDVNADNFSTNNAIIAAATADSDASENKPTVNDQQLIERRVEEDLGYDASGYPDANVVKFRTADVNNDRNVNNIDANDLRAAARAAGKFTTDIKQFYAPVDYSNLVLPQAYDGGGASE